MRFNFQLKNQPINALVYSGDINKNGRDRKEFFQFDIFAQSTSTVGAMTHRHYFSTDLHVLFILIS